MVACSTQHTASRPADWPMARKISSCTEFSGRYLNQAVSATPWMSPNYEGPDPVLSNIFYEDPDPGLDANKVIELEIRLDLTIWMRGENTQPLSVPAIGKSQSRCRTDALVWTKDTDAFSEHSKEKQQVMLEFFIAQDGSLIVHRTFSAKGTGFMLVPFSEKSEDWLRFQRAR
jgi:hypothetical protein